jgi:hypothetical protein
MNKVVVGGAVAAMFIFGNFAAGQNDNSAGQPGGRGMNQMQQMQMMQCPVKLEGVDVAAADVSGGLTVTFTAKPANVAELQRRVESMATMHSAMSSQAMQQHMIDGTVKYEALPNGARLTLTPKDPAKLKEFREQVRSRVETMKKGDCSMMGDMMNMMKMMGGMPMKTSKP